MKSYDIIIEKAHGTARGVILISGEIGTGEVPRWRFCKPGLICTGELIGFSYARIRAAIRDALRDSWKVPCQGWSEKANASWELRQATR